MYNYFLATLSFVCIAAHTLSAQGINFEHDQAWSAILAKAQQENKLIFMDAYTTWCGPCKKMARETFTQGSVGEVFNKNFINVKMDMEKGEGVQLGETYKVRAYPTLLFLNPDGSLAHRAVGFHTTEEFLALANDALTPAKRISTFEERFQRGDRDPEFLFGYAYMHREAMTGKHGDIADAYLKTQPNWNTERNQKFIFDMATSAKSPLFDFILKNKEAYIKLYGEQRVNGKLETLIYNEMEDPNASLEDVRALLKKTNPENAERAFGNYEMAYHRNRGDRAAYANAAAAYFKRFGDDAAELNEAAWTFYEVIDDRAMLKKAVKWSKKSVKLENNYANNDTLAALYYKLGKKKCALEAADKAMALGKQAGESTEPTEQLLEKIKAMK